MPAQQKRAPSEETMPLRDLIAEQREQLRLHGERLATLEGQLGALSLMAPRHDKVLTRSEVVARIAEDPRAEFIVKAFYGGHNCRMAENRRISAQHYPNMGDLVSDGLRVFAAEPDH